MVQVDDLLRELKPLLPLQNPLWAFVHNNILLEWEHLPFHEALRQAGALYRARPYETERFYRRQFDKGRITGPALEQVLTETLPGVSVAAFLEDERHGDDVPPVAPLRGASRHATYDRMLQDIVVPIISTWLDQGMAEWGAPSRESGAGLWRYFADSVERAPSWSTTIPAPVRARVAEHLEARREVNAIIQDELLRCAPAGRERAWCAEVLFALKGWSGMVNRLESDASIVPIAAPPPSLRDWLAVLLVTCHALDTIAFPTTRRPGAPLKLGRLRRWQEAYERSFAVEALTTVAPAFERARAPAAPLPPPRVQALICMDDRTESLRRALEAVGVETTGTLGHFFIDMMFHAVGAARPTRQCPPVVEPSRTIREHPASAGARALEHTRRLSRGGYYQASLAVFYQSRTLIRGVFVSLALGLLGFLPLIFKLAWPAGVTRLRRRVQDVAFPTAHTRVIVGDHDGYDLDEQANIVGTCLRAAGHTRFAPLVVVVGHGSTSTNNPFKQAYGCGACSGNGGRPNARAFSLMANDPAVRARLAARGLQIPDSTKFVPAFHDTTLGTVEWLEAQDLTPAELAELTRLFDDACGRETVERSRRFAQAPHGGANVQLQHAADRAHDLAEPRPEYGHNRVAMAIVGRRALTQQLFLDRRSFLVSYEPSHDPDGRLLADAALGSVPVAINMAMDYYFSRVDSEGFGSGSKLPLNISSLLGVITGSKSDLRIGLARQMVELHEPMRVLTLLEASLEHVEKLLAGHARLQRLVKNGWLHLGRVDPETGAITLWKDGGWRPWREVWPEAHAPIGAFDAEHDTLIEVAA